ncbi:hypothetical protein FOA52_014596 [Chlamydomonas sp. UWO 241]|nr:hypothetical protein FOA52_014596 [Chlamydomonas sp. UWO 241]
MTTSSCSARRPPPPPSTSKVFEKNSSAASDSPDVKFVAVSELLTDVVATAACRSGFSLRPLRLLGPVQGQREIAGIVADFMTRTGLEAIERPLVPRLAAFEALRGLSELHAGVMDAPIGTVCIAFANMAGLATLRSWDKDRADVALNAYTAVSKQLLQDAGGYLVDLNSSGLCLAAFHHPVDAVAWGASLIEVMKNCLWDEELLGHELCEEVLLHDPPGQSSGGTTPLHRRVLFRGPRIKIGIDVGEVQADVAPLTGRMSYHGKVMNRAARISSKASSGMQWCSSTVWEQVSGQFGARLLTAGLRGTQLGAFSLKGVTKDVKLVEVSLPTCCGSGVVVA